MNVLLAGVGGQGIILASDILSEAMMRQGYDVRKSEIHGMAQRGGSVMSHVRFADKVDSPIIPDGRCDVMLSFEELETARYMKYLGENTNVIMNDCRVLPPSVSSGKQPYPDVIPIIETKTTNIHMVDAVGIASELGNPKGVNIILLGALSAFLDTPEDVWIATLNDMLKEKIREINIKGFLKGRSLEYKSCIQGGNV